MSQKSNDKRKGTNSDKAMALATPPKKQKLPVKSVGSKSKSSHTAKKQLNLNPEAPARPKPGKNEDISSNWKSFLQAGSVLSPPESAPRPATGKRRGLAKRGCSCPPPVWFDGVDPALLEDRQRCAFCLKREQRETTGLKKEQGEEGDQSDGQQKRTRAKTPLPSHYLAMDCEMVGVGNSGQENMLARVSLVNALGQPVYDKFVKPKERVIDYRTSVSGVRPKDLVHAEPFEAVQKEVAALLKGRVLVGHAVHNDLRVLLLSHPKRHTRDTASYKPFRKMFNGNIPSLKNLAHKILAVNIQGGEHDSVQDARATMQVYQTHRREWESQVAERHRFRSSKTAG